MEKLVFRCLIVALALPFFAQAEETSAPDAWAVEAEAFVKTLTRPIDVYNWAYRSGIQSKPGEAVKPNDPRIMERLKGMAARFYSKDAKLDQQGPNGVYLASGPFITREYGTSGANFNAKDWLLTRVTFPAGTRFFDGRMTKSFGKNLLQFIRSKGCSANSMRELMQVSGRGDRSQCWAAYTMMVPALKVQAVAKFFHAMGPDFCANHNAVGSDLILVDPNAQIDAAGFTAEIPDTDIANPERVFIRDFWTLAKKRVASACAGSATLGWETPARFYADTCTFAKSSAARFSTPWAGIPESNQQDPNFRNTFIEKIWGCGKFKEDVP